MKAQIPQINIKESSRENRTLPNVKVGSILPANTGYRNYSYIIENEDQLVSVFGKPTSSNYKFWWNIYNYLQYANEGIYVINPTSDDKNYSMKLTGSSILVNNIENSDLYNTDLASNLIFNNTLTSHSLEVYNRYVENEDKLAITVCGAEDAWENPITNEEIPIIRDIGVYIHEDVSSIYSNSYILDTYVVIDEAVYSHNGVSESCIISLGNQTHIKAGENINIDYASIKVVNRIESNNYRVEDTLIGFQFTLIIGDGTPAYGEVVKGSDSGVTGKVHQIIGNSVILYNLTGDFDNNETILINDVAKTTTIASLTYPATPIFILGDNHQYLEDDDIIKILDDDNNYLISSHNYDNVNNVTDIIMTKEVSSYNELTSSDKLVIQSDTTMIIIDNPEEDSVNYITYLGGEWNDANILSGIDKGVFIFYNINTLQWEIDENYFNNNSQCYVLNKNKVYSIERDNPPSE